MASLNNGSPGDPLPRRVDRFWRLHRLQWLSQSVCGCPDEPSRTPPFISMKRCLRHPKPGGTLVGNGLLPTEVGFSEPDSSTLQPAPQCVPGPKPVTWRPLLDSDASDLAARPRFHFGAAELVLRACFRCEKRVSKDAERWWQKGSRPGTASPNHFRCQGFSSKPYNIYIYIY